MNINILYSTSTPESLSADTLLRKEQVLAGFLCTYTSVVAQAAIYVVLSVHKQ